MIVEFPFIKNYLFHALKTAPELMGHLLSTLTLAEADFRPDPERFTIREIIAHLADWDDVFYERLQLICEREHPTLPDRNPDEMVVAHDYASKDVAEQVALYAQRRAKLIAYLNARQPAEWQRLALRPEVGDLSLEAIAVQIVLHDSYHTAQVAEWRDRYGAFSREQ